jgi:DNA-binding LacI/PurR family transcriptional regulator
MGVRVTQDISIVGYDNIDSTANSTVPLTTVAQDFYLLARAAAERLVERLDLNVGRRPAHIFIKPRLVVRGSAISPPRVVEVSGERLVAVMSNE